MGWRVDEDDYPIGDLRHTVERRRQICLKTELRPVATGMLREQDRVEIEKDRDRPSVCVGLSVAASGAVRQSRRRAASTPLLQAVADLLHDDAVVRHRLP